MADKVDPRTGELLTANYGWTKPTVGASTDAWGGMLNADLDSIDSIVYGIDTRPGGITDAPSNSTAYMRSNAGWSSGGVLSGTLAVGVAGTAVNALTITPGGNPASANPAQIVSSNAASGVLINSAWTFLKSGGVAVMQATGNGSIFNIGQGNPNNLTFENNGNGSVFMLMDQTSANVNPGNYLQILNAPLGNPSTALIQTAGGSTNRGIQLVPNGTGTVQAPTMAQTDSSTAVATTAFVHAAVIGDNRIINGDMRIDQRNNGASGTAVGYMLDRWQYLATQASKFNWGRQVAGANLAAVGFSNNIILTSASAYASLAADGFRLVQVIEADMVSDFAWGTASAQLVTLSFWATSSLTGTFSGSIANYPFPSTRSYPFTFSIPTANAWTKIVVSIPGDTSGTWNMAGNSGGVAVQFDLGCGSNFRGPANAWASANYIGATGSVSVVGTNAATFYVTGVKLEIGSVATLFNRQSLAKSMADCQRYYQKFTALQVIGYAAASGATVATQLMFPPMRTTPTATPANQTYSNSSALNLVPASPANSKTGLTATAAGSISSNFDLELVSEL